ncbi:MAG: hypothetical protein L6R40_007515 [Gallowayella cf. fulva]|nr:MAG: hypothetical protein L6R40_007515 [Xanthomendoza cf. fulva]
MPDASQSIYASTPFKFIVDSNPYYIHAKLVSRHSPPLDRMINGQMAEAQKGFAVLEEVDEGTFERFIEWAYKGYYTAADFELKASSPQSPASSSKEECETTECMEEPLADLAAEPEPLTEQPTIWDLGNFQSGKKSKKSKKAKTRQELKASFIRREYTVRRGIISLPPARANRGADEDYTEVFLSHARLYVFADKYDIQPLKTLALEELHDTLATYTLYRGRIGDILALLRYVYANTGRSARGGEDLRMLLRDYLGYEMNVLMEDGEFSVLMIEDGGPLLEDFIEMVAKRIN